MGKILCGFVGIGKSTVSKIDKNIKCYDLDPTYFTKNEGWEDIYIDCALGLSKEYDYVFLTTYVQVMERLNARGIEWWLVYPSADQKIDYKKRAIERCSPKEFVEGFFGKWDDHIRDVECIPCKHKIQLSYGEHLTDALTKIK